MQGTELEKQEDIKRFLSALNAYGLEKEQQQVEVLINYLDEIDQQFHAVLEELQSVNTQLKTVQEVYGVETLAGALGAATNTQNQIVVAKDKLIQNAKTSVTKLQERSAGALQKTVEAMKIPAALTHLKGKLHRMAETINRTAEQIGAMQGELQAASIHAKNAGRAMLGKELTPVKGAQPDTGMLGKVQNALKCLAKTISGLEQKTAATLEKVESLQNSSIEKYSVRQELKDIRKSQSLSGTGPRLKDKVR